MDMKRFLLFASDYYYPGGGWNDFQGSFESLDEAMDKARDMLRLRDSYPRRLADWYHVIDAETGDEVASG